jgi:hypothetical protein
MRRWRSVVAPVVALTVAGVCGCRPEPPYDTAPHDAITATLTPSAVRGVAATTREFTTFDELLRAVEPTGDCRRAEVVGVDAVSFYLADGMAPLIAAVAVCDGGRGPVIGMLNPGEVPAFQETYRQAVTTDPVLWSAPTHLLMVGNGFFVFPLTTVTPGWDFSGLRHLRCDPGHTEGYSYAMPIPADVPGCSLHEHAWGT